MENKFIFSFVQVPRVLSGYFRNANIAFTHLERVIQGVFFLRI